MGDVMNVLELKNILSEEKMTDNLPILFFEDKHGERGLLIGDKTFTIGESLNNGQSLFSPIAIDK